VTAQTIDLDGLSLSANFTFTSATNAKSIIQKMTDALQTATNKLSSLGTSSTGLDTHLTFVGKLQDSLDAGVGNLVDADLAKESSRLQALQVQQQLSVQTLNIANQKPSGLLSLFR